MYIQFGKCFCKGIQLNEFDFILTNDGTEKDLFILGKMSDHKGTVAEIGFPETAEMVAEIHNLIQDGLKYRELRRLLK
jgi:hypothetical protein